MLPVKGFNVFPLSFAPEALSSPPPSAYFPLFLFVVADFFPTPLNGEREVGRREGWVGGWVGGRWLGHRAPGLERPVTVGFRSTSC